MFEVGKSYEVRMLVDGEETSMTRRVERYDHPLLKFADVNFSEKNPYLPGGTVRGEIINVTSPSFVSAVISRHEGE